MDFRRSSDQRRRRVMLDESLAAPPDGSVEGSRRASRGPSSTAVRSYTEAALECHQPRITAWIPQRGWTLAVLLLSGLAVVAGLQALFSVWPQLQQIGPPGSFSLVDLGHSPNLATWYASTLLLAVAAACGMVYWLRRHKVDDYRGRYRFWLWAAAGFLGASLDSTAGLRHAVSGLAIYLSGTTLYGDGAAWWLAAYGVVLGPLGLWMVIEVRRSWGTALSLVLAAALYGGAVWVRLDTTWLLDADLAALLGSSSLLLAHTLLAFAVCLYVRHVYLDAQGAVPPAKPRRKPASPPSPANRSATVTAEKKERRIDSPHHTSPENHASTDPASQPAASGPARPAYSATIRARTSSSDSAGAAGAYDPDDEHLGKPARKLSKSERRRLRREKQDGG